MNRRTARVNPDRKISETFLRFPAPLLHDLPSEALVDRAREALQVSYTAWNAVIFADVLNDHRYLDQISTPHGRQARDRPAHGTTDRPQTRALCR